jgi:hypothetical protein
MSSASTATLFVAAEAAAVLLRGAASIRSIAAKRTKPTIRHIIIIVNLEIVFSMTLPSSDSEASHAKNWSRPSIHRRSFNP